MVLSARREREVDRMSCLGEPGPVRIERGDRVVITGASGFIGSAVARAVRIRGGHVVAVVEPGADRRNLESVDAEHIVADIRDPAAIQAACAAARWNTKRAPAQAAWMAAGSRMSATMRSAATCSRLR